MSSTALKQARRTARRAAKQAARARQLAERAASTRKRRQRRNAKAVALKGATEFSSDPVLSDPVAVIELFKRWAPHACLELINATQPDRGDSHPGAPRLDGSWALAFFAHILSGSPDWQPWYHAMQSTRLWEVCGFGKRPSWQTTYLRFAELEDPRYVAAIERAANRFIRIAAHHRPHAFDFVHTDGSAGHAHVRLEHACPGKDYCATRAKDSPKRIARASDDLISDERHERSRDAEPEDPDAPLEDAATDRKLHKLSDEDAQALGLDDWRNSRYFKFGARGHIMRCRDKDTGVRMYAGGPGRKRKVWLGGYFLPAVSDYFWAPFAVHFFEADVQEHLGWPKVYKKAMAALNSNPDDPRHRIVGVVADRGFTNRTFIGFNTEHGVATITPERKLPGGKPWSDLRDPDGRWDEHAPRCKYCGGPAARQGTRRRVRCHRQRRPAHRVPLRARLARGMPHETPDHLLPARIPSAAAHRPARAHLPRPPRRPPPIRRRLRRLARPLRRVRNERRDPFKTPLLHPRATTPRRRRAARRMVPHLPAPGLHRKPHLPQRAQADIAHGRRRQTHHASSLPPDAQARPAARPRLGDAPVPHACPRRQPADVIDSRPPRPPNSRPETARRGDPRAVFARSKDRCHRACTGSETQKARHQPGLQNGLFAGNC